MGYVNGEGSRSTHPLQHCCGAPQLLGDALTLVTLMGVLSHQAAAQEQKEHQLPQRLHLHS